MIKYIKLILYNKNIGSFLSSFLSFFVILQNRHDILQIKLFKKKNITIPAIIMFTF